MITPIYVISDLHMGAGCKAGPERDGNLARDSFEHWDNGTKALEFVKHLSGLGSDACSLVILGDLFEFWQMSVGETMSRRTDLLDALNAFGKGNRDRLRYVVGNHDSDLEAFVKQPGHLGHSFFRHMTEPFLESIGGVPHYFLHGHEGDPFNEGTLPDWGRLVTIFSAKCKDFVGAPCLFGKDVDVIMESVGRSVLDFLQWMTKRVALQGRVNSLRNGDGPEADGPPPSPEMLRLEAEIFALAQTGGSMANSLPPLDGVRSDLADAYVDEAMRTYLGRRGGMLANAANRAKRDTEEESAREHIEKMRKISEQRGNARIVVGHTHYSCRSGGWYFNTGSWKKDAVDVVRIGDDATPRLYSYDGGRLAEKAWKDVSET